MSIHKVGFIPEKTGEHREKRRLGRHIHFDERSRAHKVGLKVEHQVLQSKIWNRTLPPLDQGNLGMCTGAGCVGTLATEPLSTDGVADNVAFNEGLARDVYRLATRLDSINGEWPGEDTGSTVLSAMQAAKQMGLVAGYKWCFSAMEVLQTLSWISPVEVGFNWYSSFDNPHPSGLVRIGGVIEGGHAFQLVGLDVEKQLVWAVNSWGRQWGLNGRFCFSFEDLHRLMHESGEAVIPLRPGQE